MIPNFGLKKEGPLVLLPLPLYSQSSHKKVGWNLSMHKPDGGTSYTIHYGDLSERHFMTGRKPNSGSLLIPAIDLTKYKKPVFRFWLYMDTEQRDKSDLLSVLAGKKVVWSKNIQNVVMKQWQRIEIDLTKFVGKKIDILIDFDTVDGLNNKGAGVYLDNFTVSEYSDLDNKSKPHIFKPRPAIEDDDTVIKGEKELTLKF